MIYNIAHHVLTISCILMISFNLSIVKLFNRFFENIPSIHFISSVLLERFKDFKASTCFCFCFSKAFPKGEYINLPFSIIFLRLEGNISSPVRYSYFYIFPDDNADTFVASVLISYWSFSSPILSSIHGFRDSVSVRKLHACC